MPIEPGPDMIFEACLKSDTKLLNAYLPRRRKTLSELMGEIHPHVECGDGSKHFFKKKELEYMAEMLDNEESSILPLPIMIEVGSQEGRMVVKSKSGIEARIFSVILDMPIPWKSETVTIFRPQLQIIRRFLKTTTQYVFGT